MTAEAEAVSPAELSSLPACPLTANQLGDLELLLSGALAPLTGFMTAADAAAVAASWRLADGTPFPVPITLELPVSALPADPAPDRILLSDPEGTPIAVLTIVERTVPDGQAGLVRLAGPVSANRPPEHGPFRRLMLSPAAARTELGDGLVLAFATRGPLTSRQIGQVRHLAGGLKARILILPLVSGAAAVVGSPQALIRAVLAAMPSLPAGSLLVPVPLPPHAHAQAPASPAGRARELAATARIAAAYGATHLMADGIVPVPGDGPPAPTWPAPRGSRYCRRATGPTTRAPRCGGRTRSSRRVPSGKTCRPISSVICSMRAARSRTGWSRRRSRANCAGYASRALSAGSCYS